MGNPRFEHYFTECSTKTKACRHIAIKCRVALTKDEAKSRETVFSVIKIFGLPSVRERDFTGLGSDVVAISSEFLFRC